MVDVYKNCPEYENEDYLVRMVCQEDRMDLLKVYSDKRAVPFFNNDNCGGDGFYYKIGYEDGIHWLHFRKR